MPPAPPDIHRCYRAPPGCSATPGLRPATLIQPWPRSPLLPTSLAEYAHLGGHPAPTALSQQHLAIFLNAAQALSEKSNLRTAVAEFARRLATSPIHWVIVDLLEENGRLLRFTLCTACLPQGEWADSAVVPESDAHPLARVLTTGQSFWWRTDDPGCHPDPDGAASADGIEGPGTALILPLTARGRVLGALRFGPAVATGADDSSERLLVEDLARRFAGAIDSLALVGEIEAQRQQLQLLGRQLLSAEDHERRKLATEIHDSLGQMCSVLVFHLHSIMADLPPDDKLARQSMASALQQTHQVIAQVRSMTLDLYPIGLDELGLTVALQRFGEQFTRDTKLRVELFSTGTAVALPQPLAGYLFRAVKELIVNVAKHASATEAVMAFHWASDELRIMIADDGKGLKEESTTPGSAGSGIGLRSIRERIQNLGGQCIVESAVDHGTTVILQIPLNAPHLSQLRKGRHDVHHGNGR